MPGIVPMYRPFFRSVTSMTALALVAACGDDTAPTDADAALDSDVGVDTEVDAADGSGEDSSDVPDEVVDDVRDDLADTGDDGDAGGDELAIVPLDLAPYVTDIPDLTGTARAFCTTSADQLIVGELSEGLVGDCMVENDDVRFLVAFGSNVISPCSYDGNIVDAELRNSEDWARSGDVMGEICLLLNVGQTLVPERVEIIADGSDGYAVLAVTGRTGILDFLNIRQMVEERAPGLIQEFPLDPDRIIPATVTVYYILRAGDPAVRVVTTLRNDGSEPEYLVASHMVMSGSTGGYFNPLGGTSGFGYRSLGLDALDTAPIPFIAYLAEHSAYAYVPVPDPSLSAELPAGAGQIAISGVAVGTFETLNILEMILTPPDLVPRTPGFRTVLPGEVTRWEHWNWVGDGSLATMVDAIWEEIGVDAATLRGTLVDAAGAPIVRGTVTAIDSRNRTMNQARSGADGTWSLDVPAGRYTLRGRQGPLVVNSAEVTVAAGAEADVPTLALPAGGTLQISIRTPDGAPVPGRVTVQCEGTCPSRPDQRETQPEFLPPNGWERIVSVGVSGDAEISLAPGSYRVMVSRGLEYSIWPSDAITTQGELITVSEGGVVELDAEIAHVVDSSGVLSGDFHIHAMASSDSEVSNTARVLNFLGEGVDVMVATDHDVVTDFTPTIAALGAQAAIVSIIGNEITTPNIGHFNAFPLERDENLRRGGPLDWSNGVDPNLTPGQLYAALTSGEVERVVQVNHPGGTFGAMLADVLTGQSFADRGVLRMPLEEPDPITGDTGLWSDGFTALEVMNGHGRDGFWSYFRWWLGMVSRGFTPTATAVSDTHSLYGDLGGSPRSYVFVGDADTLAPFDMAAFISAINEGRLIGSNGPFFRVELENAAGQLATLGDTISVDAGGVTARITLELPAWIEVDTIDVYVNATDDLLGAPGESVGTPHPASQSVTIPWEVSDLEVVSTGAVEHTRRRRVVEIPLTVTEDAWVVFIVRDATESKSMYPVIGRQNTWPFAFSNPVYVDADGGGYNNPPLLDEALERASQPRETKSAPAWTPGRRPTPDIIGEIIEASRCPHDHGVFDPTHVHAPAVQLPGHQHVHGGVLEQDHTHDHPHDHAH
jgi:hypothetical protein